MRTPKRSTGKTRPRRKDGPRKIRGAVPRDAKEPLNLVITQQSCTKGKIGDGENCAAALQLRSMPGVVWAHVGRAFTFVQKKDGSVKRYKTAHAMRDQIVKFDAKNPFDPGAYTLLPVPPSSIKQRGVQHSPRPPGERTRPDAPKRSHVRLRDLGRPAFHGFDNSREKRA